jgi:hypothetical protein
MMQFRIQLESKPAEAGFADKEFFGTRFKTGAITPPKKIARKEMKIFRYEM